MPVFAPPIADHLFTLYELLDFEGHTKLPGFEHCSRDVIEAVLDTYRDQRETHETFARTLNRVGFDVFKAAANSARNTTARAA